MGYTHYAVISQKEIPQSLWDSFIADYNKVLPSFINLLDRETDQKLLCNSNELFFNGIGELAHETFVLSRISNGRLYDDEDPKGYFSFCKTARKPYDIAVCSALIIAKKHFDSLIDVDSDGTNEDWKEAKALCHKILGYGNLDFTTTLDPTTNEYEKAKSYGKLVDKELTVD